MMNQFVVEQNSVRYIINPINPLANFYNMYQQQSAMNINQQQLLTNIQQQVNIKDYINYRSAQNEWSVHFSNTQNLSIPHIERIFEYYGKINSVVKTRASNQIVYINFDSEISAQRCVCSLMKQSYINLQRFGKNQNNNYQYSKKFIPRNNDVTTTQYEKDIMNECSSGSVTSETSTNNSQNFSKKNSSKLEINEITREKLNDKSQEIIAAQEIIVGNIPDEYGVTYILHLMEKFQPICISNMKTLFKNSLRYCHVYFKTSDCAKAAENNWDNIEFCGKKLIVLRPHMLAIEASNCEN